MESTHGIKARGQDTESRHGVKKSWVVESYSVPNKFRRLQLNVHLADVQFARNHLACPQGMFW